MNFTLRRQLEDREHFYFTDDLPEGGKRYLAYPKTLVNISVLGLLGCVSFLFVSKVTESLGFPSYSVVIAFVLLVVSPWIGIIWVYCRSLRSISVTRSFLEVSTRFRSFQFEWKNIAKVVLSHSENPNDPDLRLVIVPKDKQQKSIVIDYNDASSAIRARSYLIMELNQFYRDISFERFDALNLSPNQVVKF